MTTQSNMKLALALTLLVITTMSGLVTMQTIWVFAQGNISQGMNQTGNQTGNQSGNQSLPSAIPGQLGGTPPSG
jgi:hypothetical protein